MTFIREPELMLNWWPTKIHYYGIISDGDDNLTQNNTEEAAAVDGK